MMDISKSEIDDALGNKKLNQVVHVKVKKLNEYATMPEYKTGGAACMDICYYGNDVVLKKKSSIILGTGLAFELPDGYRMVIKGRSGLAFNDDIIPHIGTLDEDYRGKLKAV